MTPGSIDIDRVRRGMRQIAMRGIPDTGARSRLITDVARDIRADPATALPQGFLALVKDRRGEECRVAVDDCSKGCKRPVTFAIARAARRGAEIPLDADGAYALDAAAQFVSCPAPAALANGMPQRFSLFQAIECLEMYGPLPPPLSAARLLHARERAEFLASAIRQRGGEWAGPWRFSPRPSRDR